MLIGTANSRMRKFDQCLGRTDISMTLGFDDSSVLGTFEDSKVDTHCDVEEDLESGSVWDVAQIGKILRKTWPSVSSAVEDELELTMDGDAAPLYRCNHDHLEYVNTTPEGNIITSKMHKSAQIQNL